MKNYSDTLNLPKTAFSMKANLPEKEPSILKKWEDEKIYEQLLSKGNKTFVFHDELQRLQRQPPFIV